MNEEKFNKKIKGSMIINYITKILAISITFFNVRILIGFLGTENYGWWTTVLSIVSWVSIGDFGIGNGLRNKLTECLAKKEYKKAKEYVSTAYYYLFRIACVILAIGVICILYMIKNNLLDVEKIIVIAIMVIGISINFVLNIIGTILYANNSSGSVGITNLVYNFLYIILLSVMNIFFNNKSLIMVSIAYIFSLIFANVFTTIKFYKSKKYLTPKRKYVNKNLNSDIMGLGIRFFILQIAGIILFSTDNLLIGTLISYDMVTYYDIINKIFTNINNLYSILLIPIWSATTYAYANKQYEWIKKTSKKLHILLILFIIFVIIVSFAINYIITLWIGKSIIYDVNTIIIFALYSIVGAWLGIYCSFLNGIGAINMQMYLAIFGAIVNIPLSIYFSKKLGMGMIGIKFATFLTQLLQAIILPVQYYRIMNKKRKENIE